MFVTLCLSVCTHISKTTRPNFTEFSAHGEYGRGSVPLWRRCDISCISGFAHDVIFSQHGSNGASLYERREDSALQPKSLNLFQPNFAQRQRPVSDPTRRGLRAGRGVCCIRMRSCSPSRCSPSSKSYVTTVHRSNLGRAASPPLTAEKNHATSEFPLVTTGCLPTFTPKIAPSRGAIADLSIPSSSLNQADLAYLSKRNPDPVGRFATVHTTDRPTDRPTQGIGDRSVPRAAYAYCIATRLKHRHTTRDFQPRRFDVVVASFVA